ncbi:unnamed protein product [Durusdinium trenchii]
MKVPLPLSMSSKVFGESLVQALTPRSPLPLPKCLVNNQVQRPANAKTAVKRSTCKILFPGFDLEQHEDFELVPRIIGRNGCNVRWIASSTCKVRVRGRGSGHLELENGQYKEADAPLQISLSCASSKELESTVEKVLKLMQVIESHFVRYCHSKGLRSGKLYTLVRPEPLKACRSFRN